MAALIENGCAVNAGAWVEIIGDFGRGCFCRASSAAADRGSLGDPSLAFRAPLAGWVLWAGRHCVERGGLGEGRAARGAPGGGEGCEGLKPGWFREAR